MLIRLFYYHGLNRSWDSNVYHKIKDQNITVRSTPFRYVVLKTNYELYNVTCKCFMSSNVLALFNEFTLNVLYGINIEVIFLGAVFY